MKNASVYIHAQVSLWVYMFISQSVSKRASKMALVVKTNEQNLPADVRDGFDPWVRKVPEEGNDNPLQ